MQPWYEVVTLRQEVREGRSFSPDEFAIAHVSDFRHEGAEMPW